MDHRILLIEDDADMRDALAVLLEYQGYRVTTACNGKEGLQCLKTMERPCLILLDLMMPVMDGWQFRRHQAASRELSQIPVIVVSAAGKDRIAEIDANAYLTKPLDLDQLLARVSEYCSH